MTKFYIKRDELYLHVKRSLIMNIKTTLISMKCTQFSLFLKEKDGAKQFSSRSEAETYVIKRRLRRVKVNKEMY